MPRRWASATSRSKSASVPNSGSTRVVVADVVADVVPGRRVDRRQPDRVDAETVGAEVVEVVDDAGQVADAVAVVSAKLRG